MYSGVGHAPPRNAASLVATGFIVMVEFAHFNRDEEEFPMTEDRLLIEELAAKGGQPDFLRTIAENVLQLIMEADVDGLIGAGRHERSSERATWRNGYRDRSLDTRVGTLNLKIPKLGAGSTNGKTKRQGWTRRFASRCSRGEQAFTVALKLPPLCPVQPFLVRHRDRSAMLSTNLRLKTQPTW